MVQGLLEGKLDIAIARLHPSRGFAGLKFETLVDEPHGMIARALRFGAAGIITRRGRYLSPGAAAMLTELREAAARLYARTAAKAG